MTAWQRLFRPQGGDFITDESERGRLRGPLEGGDHRPSCDSERAEPHRAPAGTTALWNQVSHAGLVVRTTGTVGGPQ